jgi:hypothetical protein|nr:MAG TPA: hypothetical protein [Caudoviricetes sp.]
MKKLLFSIFLIMTSLGSFAQNKSTEDVAKGLIKEYFRENMNDFESYSPVSFSAIDSLFTSISDNEFIMNLYIETKKAQEDAGLRNVDITYDISSTLAEMEENEDNYKPGVIAKWKLYQIKQKMLLECIENFTPVFKGWKIAHKYRAKNEFNAVIIHNEEFQFDKELNNLIKITPIE